MTTEELLSNLWRWKCGMPEKDAPTKAITLEELRASEWNPEFEELMRHRLIIGALRYGRIGAKDKPKYARINSILKRATLYTKTGNKEMLVDIANLCLLEYTECNHPNQHFSSIDDGEHVDIV